MTGINKFEKLVLQIDINMDGYKNLILPVYRANRTTRGSCDEPNTFNAGYRIYIGYLARLG